MKKLTLLSIITATSVQIMATTTTIAINKGWQMKQARLDNCYEAKVPGTVHTDLMREGIIDDPFFRLNERAAQWVDKEDWEYRTSFDLAEDVMSKDNLRITFHGLDTYADVYLNDSLILKANNMFRTWKVDIKGIAKAKDNQLRVYFHSPIKIDVPKYDALPYHYPARMEQSENGGLFDKKISIFARKAGYHYGWDWGPRLVTSGIWRPVEIEAWDGVKIDDVHYRQPSVDKKLAKISANLTILAGAKGKATVSIIDVETGKTFAKKSIAITKGDNHPTVDFEIKNPRLWWTNGLGSPEMYRMRAVVEMNGDKDVKEDRIGVRSLRLVTDRDEQGRAFYFVLNGEKVFMKGANYIPCDNFLPRVTDSIYRATIHDAKDANMNMLRVWGGGVYEDDRFYNLCDENGILIWQDFMFACSLYPGSGEYLENVRQEAIDNVRRLRNHPCIAHWCGNNECQDGWYDWGWKKGLEAVGQQYADKVWQEYGNMFYDALPKVVEQEDPDRTYWPSSPFGDYGHGSTKNEGDYHYWGVWHGKEPITNFNEVHVRFCSEYGMQSFPEYESVKVFAPEKRDWDIHSEVMMSHQRGGSYANGLIESYLLSEYQKPDNFERMLYVGQVMQGDAMKTAIESHRRDKGYCWGTLLWQINDCWPVASWSTRDWYGRWKAAHYMMKKAYRDILVSPIERNGEMQIFVVSDRLAPAKGHLCVEVMTMDGKVIGNHESDVTVNANSSECLMKARTTDWLKGNGRGDVIIRATLKTGNDVYANNYFLEFNKDMHYAQPNIDVRVEKAVDGVDVTLKSDTFVRGLFLSIDGIDNFFDDNFIDLLPETPSTIHVRTKVSVDEFRKQLKMSYL